MNSEQIIERLRAALNTVNSVGRLVSAAHLDEIKATLMEKLDKGALNKKLFEEYFPDFDFKLPKSIPSAKSIIIVATPHLVARVNFQKNGRSFSGLVPPTYSHETDSLVQKAIADVLEAENYRLCRAILPVKFLAVKSGLARYGKNNITYIDGLGSFYRLAAFYTDFESPVDSWGDMQMHERCLKCTMCIEKCPTGAIDRDRFLIHAEQCLTYFNEHEDDFPDWIDKSWHNSLIGCMHCQQYCPLNKAFRNKVEKVEVFSDEETDLILNESGEELPEHIVGRLEKLGLHYSREILSRNIKALNGEL